MFRFIQFALLLAAATAFTASKPALVRQSMTARHIIMTNEETESVLKTAGDCMEGECSIDEIDELVAMLKDTEQQLEARLEDIMNMVAHLQHINEKEERKTDEVRSIVKDMLRVFNTDKPGFAPMGFSGDIKGGGKTAYDVLPPKKWTNPDKK